MTFMLPVIGDAVEGQRPVLLLHGSGGTSSLGTLPSRLATDHRVFAPSHPGFDSTARLTDVNTVRDLADAYAETLLTSQQQPVDVVGFSFGGWVAMEMAIRWPSAVSALLLVDPIGVQTPDAPILDVFSLTPEQALRANYHDPGPFRTAAARRSPSEIERDTGNRQATAAYVPDGVVWDDSLPERLRSVMVDTHVIWGESERIIPRSSVATIAASVGGTGTLHVVPAAGHRPQQEAPDVVEQLIRGALSR